MQLNPLERRMSNIRLVPKVVLLMVFSTLLLLAKLWFDASNLEATLLSEGIDAAMANTIADRLLWTGLVETALMGVVFVVLLLTGSRLMVKQVHYLVGLLERFANKDLSHSVLLKSRDEFGDIAKAVAHSQENLKEVFGTQRAACKELNEIASQVTLCMDEANEAINEEFTQIEQLASAMSQMVGAIREVANHAEQASHATAETSQLAEEGSRCVAATVNTIDTLSGNIQRSSTVVNEVEHRVDRIGSVVDTIRSISEQTNLLALNAAIEAARAGEAGRGFAVVASEVRELANRAQAATVEIQKMIEQLQGNARQAVGLMAESVQQADKGVEQVTQAGTQLDTIVQRVQGVADMNRQIAAASEQQSSVAEEMNANLEQVKQVVEGSVVVLRELKDASELVEHHSQTLDSHIQAFKLA
ncbi:methyl-accepting chemotaxis protein [Aeromonas caviae]|uniref:Methyl-accepting chemotaxis protein n=1 Tax=Aeromonas caviae TaxID=648 RepID=A0AA42R611_AERCA|nr:methyl-accepting chemotaxis protein [Aeromonas caviae]MDH0432344.1 methyl-accepting chemotaxis protein [Aeromonas caviae]MDH0935193.1 methyl-accepting chemotaxis protein [Aeromonas caviae]MDH1395996.1 methyl-accepting chemotaxis protein [Aeromonas caviae]MDH1503933.1 methyl-accepting chemotaxis protein [Aeromonas caviae]MDH1803216.1 methyl-accepting chemotaxis protein [Aeromonas caviae]